MGGIAGLGDWMKKRLENASQAYDTANIFDNGLSWNTRQVNPQMAQHSVMQQAAPVGQAIVRAPVQMLNTIAAQVPQVDYTVRAQIAQATHNDQAYQNAQRNAQIANSMFDQHHGGLFNMGTFYGSDDAQRGDLKTGVQKIGGGTLQTMATVAPFAKGGSVAVAMGHGAPLLRVAPALAAEGAAYGGAFSVGNQYQETGHLDPKRLAQDTAMGAVMNAGIPAAARGVAKGAPIVAENAPRIIKQGAQAVDDATHSAIRAVTPKFGGMTKGEIVFNLKDLSDLRDYRDSLISNYDDVPTAQRGIAGAHKIMNEHGHNFLQGSRADQIAKIDQFLEQNGEAVAEYQKHLGDMHDIHMAAQRSGQGGYIKIPGGSKDPAPDLHPVQKDFINNYAEMIKGIDEGVSGGDKIPDGHGGYHRTSEHTPFYRQVFQEKGRAPTQYEWFQEARRQVESGQGAYGASDEYKQLAEQHGLSGDPFEQQMQSARDKVAQLENIANENEKLANRVDQANHLAEDGSQPSSTPQALLQSAGTNLADDAGVAKAIEPVHAPAMPGQATEELAAGKPPRQTNQPPVEEISPQAAPADVTAGKPGAQQQGFPSDLRNRGFIDTIFNDPNTSTEVKQALIDMDTSYTTRNTKQLQIKAANLVKSHPDVAEQLARNAHDDISVAVGSELIKALQAGKKPNYEAAISIANDLAKNLTEAGRMVQAASIYGKLTPDGILRFAQSEIAKYNKATGKNIQLKPSDAERLVKMSQDVQAMAEGPERAAATAKLVAEVQKTMPATLAAKLGTLQTMAQLMNLKTNVRNIGGNAIFSGVENISQTLGTPVDKLLSMFTGERTTGLPNLKVQTQGVVKGGKQAVKEAYQGINTGPNTQFELNSVPVFRGKILGNLEKTMNATLRGADRAAYTAAFDDTLHNLMKLNKVDQPTPAMLETAHQQGLYRTFQDTNRVSQTFSQIKRGLNMVGIGNDQTGRFGLGDIILKYPKTPANLLARGLDYSPAGMVRAIFEASKPLVGREFDQKAFVDSFSRSIVGSGSAFGLGYLMSQNGIITAAPEKNKDLRNLQKTQGLGGYQINASGFKRWVMSGFNKDAAALRPGDTLVSYDWAQPLAIPISAGAALGANKPTKAGAEAANTLVDSTNTLAEQPLLQGLQRFFGNTDNNGGIGGAVQGAGEDIPSSFVPTLLSQINQLGDNTTRNQNGNSAVDRATNSVKAKVPGMANDLQPSVDVLGNNKERYQDGGNNFFNVMLNPAFLSKYKDQPAAHEALRLYSQTGETKQTPNTVPTSVKINDKTIKLTPQQQGDYQRFVGQETVQKMNNLVNDPTYNSLPDSVKVNIMSSIQTDANQAAKIKLFGADGSKMSTGAAQILGQSGYDPGVGDAATKIKVEQFKGSQDKSALIGDTFYFKKGDGSVGSMPKVQYDVQQQGAQLDLGMDRAMGSNNLDQWMNLANKKMQTLEMSKQLYDPVTEADKIANITLQQENLRDKAAKYNEYGGFTKGAGLYGNGAKLPSISTAIPSDLMRPVVSQSSYQAPKIKLNGGRNVRVGRAKSSVKIKAPKRLA
jgi:hypothetical protein